MLCMLLWVGLSATMNRPTSPSVRSLVSDPFPFKFCTRHASYIPKLRRPPCAVARVNHCGHAPTPVVDVVRHLVGSTFFLVADYVQPGSEPRTSHSTPPAVLSVLNTHSPPYACSDGSPDTFSRLSGDHRLMPVLTSVRIRTSRELSWLNCQCLSPKTTKTSRQVRNMNDGFQPFYSADLEMIRSLNVQMSTVPLALCFPDPTVSMIQLRVGSGVLLALHCSVTSLGQPHPKSRTSGQGIVISKSLCIPVFSPGQCSTLSTEFSVRWHGCSPVQSAVE